MLTNIIVGLNVPPIIVALARAAVLGALAGLIGVVQNQSGGLNWDQYAWAVPFVLAGLRWLEGLADQVLTPNMNDVPPPTPIPGEKPGTVEGGTKSDV